MKTIEYTITVELPDDASALLPNVLNDGFVYTVEKLGLVCHIDRGAVVQDVPETDVCNDKTSE